MNIFYYDYTTILGLLTLVESNNMIINLYINRPDNYGKKKETHIIKEAYKQIDEYLNKDRTSFHIPINPIGTDFQQGVWDALLEIPYGKTKSYKDIANHINNPKAFRAVGGANGKNPIPIIIPCHRVINSNGKIGGFSMGIDIKKKLLELENISYTE